MTRTANEPGQSDQVSLSWTDRSVLAAVLAVCLAVAGYFAKSMFEQGNSLEMGQIRIEGKLDSHALNLSDHEARLRFIEARALRNP